MVQLVGTTSLGLGKLIDGKNQFVHIRYSAHSNGSNMTTEIQADTKYIGIATNSSETAPTSPSDYSWGRFVGTSGTSSYTWIRYSSNEDGSNMTTTTNEETKYIGVAITSENSAPTDHTKYSWALFKGEDGRGVKKTEVSYQKSTSGITVPIGTWTVTIPAVGANEYLWTRTTITYTDYSTSVSYSVGKMGADGRTPYFHTAYAYSADGTDRFTTVYPNFNLLDGTKDFSGNWDRAVGWTNDGTYKGLTVKKRTGQWFGINKIFTAPKDGTYTFSAYIKSSGNAADITRYSSRKEVEKYIGNNFDWIRDSVTVNLKANETLWIRYEIINENTNSILWTAGHKWEKGSVATPYMPSSSEVITADWPSYIGQYTNFAQEDSPNPSAYTWSLIRGNDGEQGPKGDPTGIVISATAPSNPYVNMLWKHTGSVSGLIKDATYRWNGSKWELYIFTAANITAENLSAITANLGTVTAGTITGSEFTNDFNRSYTSTLNRTGTTKLSGGKLRIDYKDVNKSTGAVSANGSYMEYNESGIDFAENDGTASGKRLELNSNRIALGSSNGTFYADPTKMQLSGNGYFKLQPDHFLGSPGNTNYQKLSWTNDGFELRPVDVNGNPRSWSTGIEIAGNNSYVDFKVPYNSNVDYDTRIILNQDKSFLIENAASGKPITLKTYDNLRVFTDNALIVRNRADSSWRPVLASGFSQQSDEKWKYNIKDMPSRLEQFKNLDFKAYRLWAENGKYQEGVIANDNIGLPFISKGYDGYTVDSYAYITFIGKATQEYIVQTDNTINELKNENAELKNKVTNLESELSNLTTELETIKQQLSILLNK